MSIKLNRKLLAETVVRKHNISEKDAIEIVDIIFDAIKQTMFEDGVVDIARFGKFEVIERAARKGINPKTKELLDIPALKSPRFRPSQVLKKAIKEHQTTVISNK